ncbi:hypothetical protein GF325_12955 [Candidatus Bathyarchaeota archaeon]|nr:hypothetical protein [Candidatus Bathyarchaeota archaeon]
MAIRKLGAITGALMIVFIIIGSLGPIDLYISMIPAGIGDSIRFYTWGYTSTAGSVNMLTLQWPSCLIAWITTISYLASTAMTISASTPGNVPKNAKRFFILSAIFTMVHFTIYLLLLVFSTYRGILFSLLGPGFYALVLFSVSNIISFVRVQ